MSDLLARLVKAGDTAWNVDRRPWGDRIDSEALIMRCWPALMDVVAAAAKLEAEMTNPVPCHVMRRKHRDDLSAALSRLAQAAGPGGEG